MAMCDVTRILNQIEDGDSNATDQLLPLVYDELRQLASRRLADEKPGQTLQATALVHEAFLRLVGDGQEQHWNGRGHFFGAAAEAMRRILVESARRKKRIKHGANMDAHDIYVQEVTVEPPADEVLAVDEALDKLTAEDPIKAEVVKLKYFARCSIDETSKALGISPATVKRYWIYAKAYLLAEIREPAEDG